jgi:hypothetical protein
MASGAFAQETQPSGTSVNRLFRLTGVVAPGPGKPESSVESSAASSVESIQFSIYDQESGGTPLWQETQTLTVDKNGKYSVLLGLSSTDGLPADLFTTSEPRWLGVQVQRPGASEQARTLLTSVPYAVKALKANDADTLGGLPASAFQLAGAASAASGSTSTGSRGDTIPGGSGNLSSGTPGMIGKFVNTGDLGDSVMFENAGRIGLGTTGPADFFHTRFTNTTGTLTGFAVQNLGSTASSYSGMLFYDHTGALGQFQGFNNSTKEYRINNVATGGSINFMLASTSRLLVQAGTGNVGISEPVPNYRLDVLHGGATGIRSRSSSTFSLVDIDAQNGDAALRFAKAGVNQWNIRNNPATDDLQFFELGGGGERMKIENTTGNLAVTTNFTAGGTKAFTIPHPLDPENRILRHAAIESNEVLNVYSGNVTTDAAGKATVDLPAYFEALNKDYRYQLTVFGVFAQAIVSSEVKNNQFEISTNLPNVKVSWEVKGIRNDEFMRKHPFQVEEYKPLKPLSDEAIGGASSVSLAARPGGIQ